MNRLIWATSAVIAAIVASAIAIDSLFKYATSGPAPSSGVSAVTIATEGILTGRRAAYLTCSPDGRARVLTKARFLVTERPKLRSRVRAKCISAIRTEGWQSQCKYQ
jgi:hypothetical protein